MTGKPEEALAALQQKNLESAMRLAQLSIENSQRILQLQVGVARDIFDDGVASAKALASCESPPDAMALRSRYAQQAAEKMFACSRNIAGITAEMQAEMARLVSEQLDAGGREVFDSMQQMLAGMPLNSHAAAEAMQHTFDTARKTLEEVARASSEAFASFAAPGTRKRK